MTVNCDVGPSSMSISAEPLMLLPLSVLFLLPV
jgi:hypothetical protein